MRVLLFALAATCSAVSLTAQQRAISDSDLFAFRWVASPQISPDGRQAAYVLVTVNAKHDGYETSLWLVNTDGASPPRRDRKSTRLNSSHGYISYAVFCLKKKNKKKHNAQLD